MMIKIQNSISLEDFHMVTKVALRASLTLTATPHPEIEPSRFMYNS